MRLASTETRPLFILGNHRSGTTWLHQLLAGSGQFNYLTAYDVVATARGHDIPRASTPPIDAFTLLGLDHRGFDGVRITPSIPEEYNFVLSNAGAGDRLNPANLSLFLAMRQRLQRSSEPRPLVLKNPWDYANFLYISQVIPGARFIFIHRHPERVVQSLLAVGRALMQSKHAYMAVLSREYDGLFSRPLVLALYRVLLTRRFDIGVRLGVRFVADANRYYVRSIGHLAAGRVLELRYEDLCADTAAQFIHVLTFCGIAQAEQHAVSVLASPRSSHPGAEMLRRQALIGRSMSTYMRLFGYRPGGIVERPLRGPKGDTS